MNPGRKLERKNLKELNEGMQGTIRRLANERNFWQNRAHDLEREIMFGYDMVLALTVEKIRESNFSTILSAKGENEVGTKHTALSLEFMWEAKSMYTLDIDRDLEKRMIILRPTLKPKPVAKDAEPDGEADIGKDG